MPRRVEDIVPGDRRSIKSPAQPKAKPVTKAKMPDSELADAASLDEDEQIRIRRVPITPPPQVKPTFQYDGGSDRKGGRGAKIFGVILVVSVVLGFAAYVASSYFARAVFTITPREVPIMVNSTYIATALPQTNTIVYTLASENAAASTSVPAIDGEKIQTKAQGTITFYNSYSTQTWRLIAGTRLTNDTGRTYRLSSSVVIPGYTKSAGGSIIPGSVAASIVADQPGPEYNLVRTADPQIMVVAAYAGSTKYASIYGRLASDLRGGQSGSKKIIAPAVLASTTAALQSRLNAYLSQQVKNSVPAGYIAYDQAFIPSFAPAEISDSGPRAATVTVHGTLYAVMFKKSDLIMKLSGDSIVQSFGGLAFDARGLDQMLFAISNLKDFSPSKKNTLIMKLKGSMKLVGTIPADQLKIKFAGLSLSETGHIMQSLSPVIDLSKSGGQVVPPWSKIPSDPDRISIVVQD